MVFTVTECNFECNCIIGTLIACTNPMCIPIMKPSPTAQFPGNGNIYEDLTHVSAIQGKNDARIFFSGSYYMCSNEYIYHNPANQLLCIG